MNNNLLSKNNQPCASKVQAVPSIPSIPCLQKIPRLNKKHVNFVQKYMEESKKDRLHFPHHNVIPNALKMNTAARTTVIQLFRQTTPFTLEVAFGHTIRNVMHLHVVDGSVNIRCSREVDNTIIDTEAPFTSSWKITKELLNHYRITLRPLKKPLLLIMEEIHTEALCPLPPVWPIQQPLFLPNRVDNQDYAFISLRCAFTDKQPFPVAITILGNNDEILLNTVICPRSFIKHMTTDTHGLIEDDLMRGMDHYIAYPLIKAVLANRTLVGYKTRKLLDELSLPLESVNTYVDIQNLAPSTLHYTEYRLPRLIQDYLTKNDQPTFPIKSTLIEATAIRKIFMVIKAQFKIKNTAQNPYTHLVNNIKDQRESNPFKIPSLPGTSSSKDEANQRRKSSPISDIDPRPPKNRKVLLPEDPFAELDDMECNQQDSRTITLRKNTPTISQPKPFPRPTKVLGYIAIKPLTDVKEIKPQKTLTHEEITKMREQRKPTSNSPIIKETPQPIRPVGPQKILQHPFPLMGMVELDTNNFLKNLEAMATKREATTPLPTNNQTSIPKNDPAQERMDKIKAYVQKREEKLVDPGHPSVTPNGHYARATADYDDSQYTWDYFIYVQYFEGDHPKSLMYDKIPPMPKLPDCGIMEVLYIPVRYRGYPIKNIHLLSSYIIREYRDARKIRTYNLFTRTIQPPSILPRKD